MKPKFGLGKGLEALLPIGDMERAEFSKNAGEMFLPIERIVPNPGQPRKFFDEAALKELADSIHENGILQPIIVEETSGDPISGGVYTIIAGERRYRAAKLAGLERIPALVRSYSDEKRLTVSIIENIQRADLNPIEEAAAYKQLIDLTGMSQDEAAAKLGTKRSTLANAMRLLKLPEPVQNALISSEITPGHARAILSLEDESARGVLFERIIAESLNVRQAEKLAGDLLGSGGAGIKSAAPGGGKSSPSRDPNLEAMEQKFIETLGTKVRIDGDFSGGALKIEYYNADDLDRLYNLIAGA
ncbi:MAG: ParB/RepB/Spo0J family partition protein [Spirochaetaceae bacterium]|jgi:ParB family chromosome partitioning protein|nr:ParB/RepB/Spo0J family partition protein [Spirochaetaceae bacterium]